MKTAYEKVQAYHSVFGHRLIETPTPLPQERIIHRAGFMAEELAEFLKASPDDLVTQSDALIDLLYFVLGTFVEMGVDPTPLFEAVHQANMDKLWDGQPRYDPTNGKTLKPPGWVGPEERIRALIEEQRTQAKKAT
jgi:predicted HAD superfamily Cof-like phosphohydrolase